MKSKENAALATLFALCVTFVSLPSVAVLQIDAAETRLADVVTNAWEKDDRLSMLELLERRYRRDIATQQGRVAWHGREVTQTVATNASGRLVMRRAYADGFTFDDEARGLTPREAASNSVRRVRAALPTNGVPKGLARRRAQAAARAEPSVTNVTVTVGISSPVRPRTPNGASVE